MTVEIIKHKVTLKAESFDEKTKVVTIKFFGKMQKFREDEYKIIKEKI